MRILFAAGGTGGHINPALAVAGHLVRKYGAEAEILFIGTADRMEARLVPQAGFNLRTIKISGFYRGLSLGDFAGNIRTFFRLFTSFFEARRILKEFRPDIAVGFGGYVSGPVLSAALTLGIPIALHEQNAFPGVTNKLLARFADVVMLSSADAEKRISCRKAPVLTGLPVRGELLSADREQCRKKLNIPKDKFLILSMGGSLGAQALNEAMCGLIAAKKDDGDCVFLHAYGSRGAFVKERLCELGVAFEERDDIRLREYIDDMELCMPAADLVICRAGASTLYELRALGRASILIPSPNVAENHQYYNAAELEKCGAALLIEEKDLSVELLTAKLNELLKEPGRLREMEKKAREGAFLNSAELISECILSAAKLKG